MIFVLILFIVIFISVNPGFFIKENFNCNNIKIYYKDKSFDVNNLCENIESLCLKNSLCNFDFKIFITPSQSFFYIFSFFSKNFVWINPFKGYAVIYPIDLEKKYFLNTDINYREKINEVLIRWFILNKKTFIEYITVSKWKIIGYAKYITGDIQEFLEDELCIDDFKKNKEKYKEFEYMMIVKYILAKKNYNDISDFFVDNISYEHYFSEMKNFICRK